MLAPGVGINCCEALLRDFQARTENSFAQCQIPHIVRALIREIQSGVVQEKAPIVNLIIGSLTLGVSAATKVIVALHASPAMDGPSGIPFMFEAQADNLGQLQSNNIDLDLKDDLEDFFREVATSFYVFEVSRPPWKYPNFQRSGCKELASFPEGYEVNQFLRNPHQDSFTSVGWTANARDKVMSLLTRADGNMTVKCEKVRHKTTYQLKRSTVSGKRRKKPGRRSSPLPSSSSLCECNS